MRVRVGLYYLVCVYHIHMHIHRDICTPCLSERPMDLWSHGEIKTLEVIPPQLPRSCAAGSRMFALRTLLSLQRRQGAKCEAGRWVPQTSIKLLLVLQHWSLRVIVWRSSTSKVDLQYSESSESTPDFVHPPAPRQMDLSWFGVTQTTVEILPKSIRA